MQLVRHLLTELERFGPDAEVIPPVEVNGIAPENRCEISGLEESSLRDQVASLEKEKEELDGQLMDAKEEKQGVEGKLDRIKSLMAAIAARNLTKKEIIAEINEIIDPE